MTTPYEGVELPSFMAIEVTVLQEAPGAWRVFVMKNFGLNYSSPLAVASPFDLPTFPSEATAMDFATLLAWKSLDNYTVLGENGDRPISVLE